jgi:hypothetical protein
MRSTSTVPFVFLLTCFLSAPADAAVPGGIEITCDVDRRAFRSAATGESTVTFRLHDAETGGSQVGPDYVVPMADLIVEKVKAESKYDSVKRRPYGRLEATIGDDGTPVDLGTGEAWLDITIGTTTITCDEGKRVAVPPLSPPARKRVQSVAFAREAQHSDTCETCTSTTDISARVFRSTNFSTNGSAGVPVTFDGERWDTADMFDPGDPTKLCVPVSGKYFIFGNAGWEANATGVRSIAIKLEGTTYLASVGMPGSAIDAANDQQVSTHYQLNADECVELEVFQTSGTGLEIRADPNFSAEFGIVRLP